jgi:plastocyanin
MAFNPSSITIAAGTTITWTNKDPMDHTVTNNNNFDSGTIGSGKTWSFTFSNTGTYTYLCSLHSTMTAKVIVN